MKKLKHIAVTVFSIIIVEFSLAQDPSFSQFFSSPLNINPALTANINEDWRVISNMRDQWIGPASPYATGSISFDSKIMQNKIPNVSDKNVFGIGGMLMYDDVMYGIVQSTYASLNLSYNLLLAEDFYGNKHRLGIGFGETYGRRFVDFSRLNFQEQFTGTGFNTNLPTGEAALSNMKPYFSSNIGMLYSYKTEKSNLDIGASVYHLNKPKQTFLADPNQYLPMRDVVHINYERFLSETLVLNSNAIYQYQGGASYLSLGGALGFYLEDDGSTILNLGMWYWSKNAVIPYVGMVYNNFQFGLSYDATVSKLNQAAIKPTTWELSLIVRGTHKPPGVIPCPWK